MLLPTALLALNVLSAATPIPISSQTCTVRNDKALSGQSFLGNVFKPTDTQTLLKGIIKGVTTSIYSKYTPNTPPGQYAPTQFVIKFERGTQLDIFEAFTDPNDLSKVMGWVKVPSGGFSTTISGALAKGTNTNRQFHQGLDVIWSISRETNGFIIKFDIDKQIQVTLNRLTNSNLPQISIQRQPSVALTDGVCR